MSYDFQQGGDIPTLAEYKLRLVRQMFRSAFFQDEKKEQFDMLREGIRILKSNRLSVTFILYLFIPKF